MCEQHNIFVRYVHENDVSAANRYSSIATPLQSIIFTTKTNVALYFTMYITLLKLNLFYIKLHTKLTTERTKSETAH